MKDFDQLTENPGPVIGDTYRTFSGNGRASYYPGSGSDLPWVCVWKGEILRHFENLDEARSYFYQTHKDPLLC